MKNIFALLTNLPGFIRVMPAILVLVVGLTSCKEHEIDKKDEIDDAKEAVIDIEYERNVLTEQAFPDDSGEIVNIAYGNETIICMEINGMLVFEGDIIIDPDILKGAGMDAAHCLWPGGIMYYTIENNFSESDRIYEAIDHWEENTFIRFEERINQNNYVEFIWDTGSYSYVGMIGGRQPIGIADWGTSGTVIHEIGHALGLYHEHSKPKRDDYIKIMWDQIEGGKAHNFHLRDKSIFTEGFDFNSIMLYSSYAFSVGMLPTIVRIDESTYSVQREILSDQDIETIEFLYKEEVPVEAPKAAFTVSNSNPEIGETITFTDHSEGIPESWLWTFGDGTISNAENPKHSFQKSGSYSVGLTVTNRHGSDSLLMTDFIDIEPIGINFNSDLAYGLVIDIEDNEYKTIQIGDQMWMAENLKTTTLNDGTEIPLVTGNTAWYELSTPAYCYFNNQGERFNINYGKLYNWYTVETGKLCPENWHVPSDEEWTILIEYLGGSSIAGKYLKESGFNHWENYYNRVFSTNESGFTALPGGNRRFWGTITYSGVAGRYGYFWSSTKHFNIYALHRTLDYRNNGVNRDRRHRGYGMSVRCVKDTIK